MYFGYFLPIHQVGFKIDVRNSELVSLMV